MFTPATVKKSCSLRHCLYRLNQLIRFCYNGQLSDTALLYIKETSQKQGYFFRKEKTKQERIDQNCTFNPKLIKSDGKFVYLPLDQLYINKRVTGEKLQVRRTYYVNISGTLV